ncbi:hypothetical protein BvCmsNSNP012_01994 [Escherichia coli]|nr:hypothetical protein BvCmsNSNP012_01994 [Escherichia coli]
MIWLRIPLCSITDWQSGLDTSHHGFYSLQNMFLPVLQAQDMNDKLRFEMPNNLGYFLFPETWFDSLRDEFEELFDTYDCDEVNEANYVKLWHLSRLSPDFINIHAHQAFLEQNTPRKALNA